MNEFDPMLGGVHVVDIGVLVVLLISAILGMVRGFIRELFSILAWVGAAAISYFAYPLVQPWLNDLIGIELLSELGSAVGVFIIAMIVLTLIFAAIADKLRGQKTGALDRSLGLVYGLARGGVVLVAAYMIFSWFVPPQEQWPWLESARTIAPLRNASARVEQAIPEESWAWLSETLDKQRPTMDPIPPLDPALATELLSEPPPAPRDGTADPAYDGDSRSQLDEIIRRFQQSQGGSDGPQAPAGDGTAGPQGQ
jgi:membrane protein required for colicin V production